MFDYNNVSTGVLMKIGSVLKIVLDEIDIQGENKSIGNKILIKKFERNGLFYEDVASVTRKINSEEGKDIITLVDGPALLFAGDFISERFRNLEEMENAEMGLGDRYFTKRDLEENVIVIVKDLNRLKDIKDEISEIVGVGDKKETIKKQSNGKNNGKKIILYLSKTGELWREPKKQYCYPIEEGSNRLKIVSYFAEKQLYGYFPTYQIADDLDLTGEGLSKQIGRMRDIAQGKLKIKFKILEGKRKDGYRINPKCKIIAEK